MPTVLPLLFPFALALTQTARAPGQEAEVSPQVRTAIEQAVAAYNQALKDEDPALFESVFEGERLLDAMLGSLEEAPAALSQPEPRRQFLTGLSIGLVRNGADRAWDRHRVQRIVLHPEEGRAEAIVWGTGGFMATESMRLWLSESDGRWRVFDFEDLDLAIPAHVLLSVALAEGPNPAMRVAATSIPIMAQALSEGDLDTAWELLERMESLGLPAGFDVVVAIQRAAVELASEEMEDSIASADRALAMQPDCPAALYCRAWANFGLNDFDRALADAVQYQSAVGTSPSGCELQGDCLRYLGRSDEALEVYRQGLAIDPASAENLAGLSMLAPEEVALAAARQLLSVQRERMAEVCSLLQDEREYEAMLHLGTLWREEAADEGESLLAEEFLAEACFALGLADRAAESWWRLAQEGAPEDAEYYLHQYLVATTGTEDRLQGYRRVEDKPYAFEAVADALLEEDDEATQATLEALIALHRESYPEDDWLDYYTGTLHWLRGELDAAAEAYARAAAGTEDEDILWFILDAQQDLYFEAGWITRALKELGDPQQTFEEYVSRALYDEDAEVLSECVAAIGEPVPHAALLAACQLALEGEALEADRAFAEAGELPEDSSLLYPFENQRFRAAMDAGRLERALALARESTARDDDPYYEVMILGLMGQHDEALEALRQCCDEHGYTPYDFAEEVRFGPILMRHPAYTQIRAEWDMDDE